jgi:hypothetical protein
VRAWTTISRRGGKESVEILLVASDFCLSVLQHLFFASLAFLAGRKGNTRCQLVQSSILLPCFITHHWCMGQPITCCQMCTPPWPVAFPTYYCCMYFLHCDSPSYIEPHNMRTSLNHIYNKTCCQHHDDMVSLTFQY